MRPSPDRLILARYPHRITVPVRFGDLDPLGHVNNVAIGYFYEEGRAALNRAALPKDLRQSHGMRIVIADLHIAYLDEAHYPGEMTVATGISRIGASSYTSASALFRGETCIGVCDTVMVNTCDGVSTPLPEEARAALGRYLLKPQEGEAAAE